MSLLNNIKWSPLDYSEAQVLAKEVGEEMLARMEWMMIEPNFILDVGCGVGNLSSDLQKRYPKANVISIDSTFAMCEFAKEKQKLNYTLCANGEILPFKNHSIDVIFANLFIPWCEDLNLIWEEWLRVLKPDGLVIFSALGLDTLQEFNSTLNIHLMPKLYDMHDIGDLLLEKKFVDPVLDVNHYTISYQNKEKMLHELSATGLLLDESNEHFSFETNLTITFEVIFAHAFAPKSITSNEGIVKIPISAIKNFKK